MSFQDVGKRNSNRPTATGGISSAPSSGNAKPSSSSSTSAWGSLSIPAATAMSQISDSLTQYQRNVGILEKIAQSLLTTSISGGGSSTRSELEMQYKAQCDVLRQLEMKLKEQIVGQRNRLKNAGETSTQKQALMKLERDFERVSNAVVATKSKVTRQMKQYQQRAANNNNVGGDNLSTTIGSSSAGNQSTSAQMLQTQQQLIQQQLEQDRLNEEIMREREEEIRKINQGMHTVNEIYKDLAHIVGQQQDDVDKIETQMEDARDTAQSGLDQVHQANEKYGSQQCVIM
mmetsp:Transcript_60573/g.148621  ORF Transcript_60573/g.148621 Transcript_60573/m.148621 type:complete len:288 (-) Transcript_60573:198-1061(-)